MSIKSFINKSEPLKAIIRKTSRIIPDEPYIKLKYRWSFGRYPDLKNPLTYNEKVNWLKLHDRKPIYTQMVDKYEVKGIVAKKIGEQYIIPTYGVWESFDQIDFDMLPDQFVLKGTHDGGSIVICKDKKELDKSAIRKKLTAALKENYYWHGREWPYKNVKPRIIAEAYMIDNETEELRDYKFFCFNGVPKALFIATDRQRKGEETKFDFFDMDFNHLNIRNGHENAKVTPAKPVCFEEMKSLASVLSKGIPQLRVDFYEVNGKVYFGELTFSHWDAMIPFEPEKWDRIFGDWIELPPANA